MFQVKDFGLNQAVLLKFGAPIIMTFKRSEKLFVLGQFLDVFIKCSYGSMKSQGNSWIQAKVLILKQPRVNIDVILQ